ncbi:energy-coupling factor ABC transporter ATP-binding protein [Candidatus Enterococcus ferrettii]|uniref:Energy-coupling factor transport system ATP-binding protein n=1 Tax=Candidatus Enterococcus ferrettii TaxID=2815324 RepID=A0ABV0EUZ8_9ENTE|nr:ABC transporter ATP-binding protein [Enterococcus sp. 665A]MBO1341663.1 ABC transporter ATP-binding protein [Enterococcus sp. 665A]
MITDTIIESTSFSYRYNEASEVALKDITFEVQKGEIVAIVGANGAGKSTLCNALAGLIPNYFVGHTDGVLQIDGKKTIECSVGELSQTVGLVFQNPFNQLSYTADTVSEELAFGLGNRGVPKEIMIEKINKVADIVQIKDLLDKNPLELSGGQVQRVALASAIILEPKVLVLDECTTQLDPVGSQQIMKTVKRLNQNGMTIIMVDHDMEKVAELADRVLVLRNGNLLLNDSPAAVFSNPNIVEYGIAAPDYYEITKDYDSSSVILTEEQAIKKLEDVLASEN